MRHPYLQGRKWSATIISAGFYWTNISYFSFLQPRQDIPPFHSLTSWAERQADSITTDGTLYWQWCTQLPVSQQHFCFTLSNSHTHPNLQLQASLKGLHSATFLHGFHPDPHVHLIIFNEPNFNCVYTDTRSSKAPQGDDHNKSFICSSLVHTTLVLFTFSISCHKSLMTIPALSSHFKECLPLTLSWRNCNIFSKEINFFSYSKWSNYDMLLHLAIQIILQTISFFFSKPNYIT